MLNFINTSILIGLVGVFIPLIIHLLARQKVKKIYFSSILFLKQIQKQHFKRMQIRQILLLVLRCLAVLFIILAFARPTFKSGTLFHGGAHASAVLAVDQSMSMARGEVWAKAMTAADGVADMLDAEDQSAVLIDPAVIPPLLRNENSHLHQKIEQLTPQYAFPAMESILKTGDTLLSSTDLNREIYYISDLQAASFSDTTDSTLRFSHLDHFFIIPVQEDVPNIALVDGGIGNQIITPGGSLRIFAQVQNYSDRTSEGVLVRLFVNERAVAQKIVTLPSGVSTKVAFSFTPEASGWMTGEIEIEDDAFPQDNRFYFTMDLPARIKVLILAGRQEDILPIRYALAPIENSADFKILEGLIGLDWSDAISHADVVFMNNCPTLTELELQSVRRFRNRGGGLIVIPGSATDLRQVSGQLFDASHWILGNVDHGEDAGSYRSLGRIDYQHPLFEQIFKKRQEQLRSPKFFRSIHVTETEDSQTLIRFRDGTPFLLVQSDDRGTHLFLASGIAPPWSDFQTTPFFAPLIHRMALFAAGSHKRFPGGVCGQPVRIFVESVPRGSQRYSVESPSEEKITILPEITGDRMQLWTKSTEQPGFYRFFKNDSLLAVRAVNPNPAESDFRSVDIETVKKMVPDLPVSVLSGEKDTFQTTVRNARWGREFSWEMLLMALILLLTEMAVSRATTRQEK